MYPLSHQLPVPVATTRKGRLPFRPSPQQSQDRTAYSDDYSRNQTPGISSLSLSYTSTHSTKRINESPTKAAPKCSITNKAIYHDQWKRLGFIGKGSYGQVYRALDISTGYIFAVKEVNSTKIKRGTLVQALQDERETLKELEHPNIVRYLGFEEKEGILNMFLEYVPGGTIRSCLNTHGKFKEEVTKSFTTQILQGLSYLHSKSILHRDLKSENILVEPRGICKISDFGISKKALEADEGRLYSIMKGTVAYMAPEMIDNKNKGYDSKIDIWSMGCIVFEMWTGKMPWSGSQDVQILLKLLTEEVAPTFGPPLPDDMSLSTAAESFRQEFFHFDPQKRPSAIKLLQHVYLKLPPQWAFPGVEEIGQLSDISSESVAPSKNIHPYARPPHNDMPAELNFSIASANHTSRSPSLAQAMYSDDVMHSHASSPPLISITLRPRSNLGTYATSPNTSSQRSPLNASRRLPSPDYIEDTLSQKMPAPDRSRRRPYVYQPPPLPEINVLSPYSHQLIPPISIRYSKSISQTFNKRNKLSEPVPASSFGISVVGPNLGKVDYPSGQRKAPCMPEDDGGHSDDDESYSSSTWKRPPVDIPRRPSEGIKPVESASDWNVHLHHQPCLPPSAIPRPSVETVYKGLLSETLENINLADTGRSTSSSKKRYTVKSIRQIVEARLSLAQTRALAQSPRRAHFWNSHMEEV